MNNCSDYLENISVLLEKIIRSYLQKNGLVSNNEMEKRFCVLERSKLPG